MELHVPELFQALVVLVVANGSPILVKRWIGPRWDRALDGGHRFWDGEPLFGESKTIRGLVLAVTLTAIASTVMGLQPTIGALAGAAAMLGDLMSSFIKRRMRLKPSSEAPGLDQIPESLLPLLAVSNRLGLNAADIALGVGAFWIGELVLSRILFRLRIRDRPY